MRPRDANREPDRWRRALADAATFPEYWAVLRCVYDGLPADPNCVLRAAETVAKKFANLNPDEHFYGVLDRSVKHFNPELGEFVPYFAGNLQLELSKVLTRDDKRRDRERRTVQNRPPAPHPDEVRDSYARWAKRLFDLAVQRLPQQAQDYLRMDLAKMPLKDIAVELDVSKRTLSNRYGGTKLGDLIRYEVQWLVRELPPHHQAALVRHLREDAGLSAGQVEHLLMVRLDLLPGRVLDEHELLDFLGWDEG